MPMLYALGVWIQHAITTCNKEENKKCKEREEGRKDGSRGKRRGGEGKGKGGGGVRGKGGSQYHAPKLIQDEIKAFQDTDLCNIFKDLTSIDKREKGKENVAI